MTNPFSKKEVPASSQLELDKRATNVQYLTEIQGAHPQIRITSMCDQCLVASFDNPITNEGIRYDKAINSPNSLRSRKDLINEEEGIIGPLYDSRTYVPYPIVTEVKVTKQGELGTTRKTTITILAYDDNQLLELQKCLFIPGMSVRVEWGFYMPKSTIPNTATDNIANSLMLDITKKNPNYNGLQGLVTNFTFGLSQGQYWTCTVEVISAAEALLGAPVETPCVDTSTNPPTLGRKCVQKVKNEEGKEKTAHRSALFGSLLEISRLCLYPPEYLESQSTELNTLKHKIQASIVQREYKAGVGQHSDNFRDATIELYTYKGDNRDEGGGGSGFLESFVSFFTNYLGFGNRETYITWATFEALINTYAFPINKKENANNAIGSLDSNGVLLAWHESLESTDPRVCIIPGTLLCKYLLSGDVLSEEVKLSKVPSAIVKTPNGKGGVMLSRIRLNVVMLLKELNAIEDSNTGDFLVRTYITNVLRNVNNACGNLWEFEVISNNEDPNYKWPKLSIADIKFAEIGTQEIKEYNFPGKVLTKNDKETRRSILRDMNFNMKMTSAMKTQALYSGNYKSTQDVAIATSTDVRNPCQASSIKPFQGIGVLVNSRFYTNLARKPTVYDECEKCQAPEEEKKSFADTMKDLQDNRVTDESTSQAAALLRQEYADSVYGGYDDFCAGQPLPFELSLTVDGIGGFGFGQLITCNRIPETIRDTYYWQVTSVEHTINASGWVTIINTIPRMKPQPKRKRPLVVIDVNDTSGLRGAGTYGVTTTSDMQNPIATNPPPINPIPNTGGILFDANGKPITPP